jgi:hypothetical protein
MEVEGRPGGARRRSLAGGGPNSLSGSGARDDSLSQRDRNSGDDSNGARRRDDGKRGGDSRLTLRVFRVHSYPGAGSIAKAPDAAALGFASVTGPTFLSGVAERCGCGLAHAARRSTESPRQPRTERPDGRRRSVPGRTRGPARVLLLVPLGTSLSSRVGAVDPATEHWTHTPQPL